MEEESKTHGWWRTVPGVLTTILGIITGLTGLLVALQQAGVFQKKPVPPVPYLDLCQELEGKSISVEANGFRGVIGARGIALEPTGAGSFRFETFMVFSNRQPFGKAEEIIDGTCHGTTLKFTRPLLDSTSQEYTGVMSKTGGAVIIDGHFWGESEGKKKRFNWSGRVQPNR